MTFDLAFDLQGQMQVTCHAKGHGCAICPGKLAVLCDHFGTRADVISGQYPVLLSLTLNLTLKMTLKIEMKVIFVFCVPNLTLERGSEEV